MDDFTGLLCGMLRVLRRNRTPPVGAQKGSLEEGLSEQSLEERAGMLG